MKRSMEPNTTRWIMIGRCFQAVSTHVLCLKPLGQLEVQLDGAALPGSADGILQMEVDLRAVEGAVSLVDHVRTGSSLPGHGAGLR